MQRTLLLDIETWDLVLDSNGDIAIANGPYSAQQDAVSAMRLFQGEHYYDTTAGVPYLRDILAQRPPLELVIRSLEDACLTVADIKSAKILLDPLNRDRILTGTVLLIDNDNNQSTVNL